jgi:RNA polymerase sigma-70 factor (ECF subfamily)
MAEQRNEFLPTRESLLRRLKTWDDQEGWADFFNTYWRLIYSAALKAGLNEAQAEDVVQDTIIVVAKKMRTFTYDRAIDSFKGWLLYLTRKRIALEYRRKEMARVDSGSSESTDWTLEANDLPDPAGFDLQSAWEQEWERNLWEAAIARVKKEVNAKQFQMFDLYTIKEKPAHEVARQLNVPVAQVYLAKHRISSLLKKELTRLRNQIL